MKITLNPPTNKLFMSAGALQAARFFRAISSANPNKQYVYIRLGNDIYRLLNDEEDKDQNITRHCAISTTVQFSDVHYLNVDMICTDVE